MRKGNTNRMNLIGDIHGKFAQYSKIIATLPESIQLGDFGMGFIETPQWDQKHKFIRGNHDNPKVCYDHPNFLGDYGITEDGIFYVSGALSIDAVYRTPGVSWWPNEELSERNYPAILELYEAAKPRIVIAHDAPFVKDYILGGNAEDKKRFPNRTSDLLMPAMIKIHSPEIWVHGHYHCRSDWKIDKTRYIGLAELEVFSIE